MVQALHLLLCKSFLLLCKSFLLLDPKVGPKGRTVVNASHKWLIPIFWKTAKVRNSQIRSMVVPKSLYIVAGNDVIGYFRSATNSVNATGPTASFSVKKYFLDYLGKCYS